MKINTENLPYTISPTLINILEKLADCLESGSITVNFRDPTYSAEFGGYHPVEIRNSAGAVLGFLDHEPHRIRVRCKEGKYCGYYDKRSNKTMNAAGQVIAQGDITVSLIV
jgi:hypothetical protein